MTSKSQVASDATALERLREAIQAVIMETRGFSESKQEAFCHVCRYKGHDRLHDPACSIYKLHTWLDDDFRALAAALAADRERRTPEPPVPVEGLDIDSMIEKWEKQRDSYRGPEGRGRDRRDVLYAVWVTGAQWASRTGYYGSFPPRFLPYLLALFPEVRLRDVLHAFSGSLKPGPYTRLDVNPDVKPDIVASVYDVADLPGQRAFPLIIADPPYSAEDAEQYGTAGVHQLRATSALARVLEPGGVLAWLSTSWPMHTKRALLTVGRIYVQGSTQRVVRCCSLLERRAGAIWTGPSTCSWREGDETKRTDSPGHWMRPIARLEASA